jgi:transposase
MLVSTPFRPALEALPPEIAAWAGGLVEENQSLRSEVQLLRQKLQALIARHFGGTKNEALDPRQLELLLAGLAKLETVDKAPAKNPPATRVKTVRRPARSGIPEDLPVERIELIPAEVQAQPEAFRQIDQEVTRELDYEPGRFFWRHYVRPKFVRKTETAAVAKLPPGVAAQVLDQKEVLIAALPERLVEKGLPGVGLLTHLVLSRFEDHLPYYRLEQIFRQRHGVLIARQTMIDWTEHVANWLQPIYRQMKADLLKGFYVQADETPIRYLDREERGRSCRGYFWVYSRPGADILFDWQTGRSREGPREFLKTFSGKLQTDGYGAYRTLVGEREGLQLFTCWAHARRKFIEAKDHDRRALWFLKQIGLLYALERRLRHQRAGPALRSALRAAEAKMVLGRIGRALQRFKPRVLAQSLLGIAIQYALGMWTELNGYVDHGEVEIDTNQVENAIRPTAVAKKNFLFIGHPDAGWRSAVIYSIIGSCHRHRVNASQYLRDVFERLPHLKQSQIESLTPARWAKTHPEARIKPTR